MPLFDYFFAALSVVTTFVSANSNYPNNITSLDTSVEYHHIQADIRNGFVKSRGVNLGGWLVAEHWMTTDASFWQGLDSRFVNSGEYTSITKASSPGTIREKLREHHATFITEDDIIQIAAAGLNTVRVPIGFWILGYDNNDPFNQHEWQAYTRETIEFLDILIRDWAKTHNVAVLISLHAAKGSQNGAEHSSPTSPGHAFWSQYSENVANTIEVARFVGARYLNDVAFLGIGLLNEPDGLTNEKVLYQYYKDAYRAVRSTGSTCILSVMPMLQKQSPDEMVGFLEAPTFTNVWVEWHPYFIWGYEQTPAEKVVSIAVKKEYRGRVAKWNGREKHNRLFIGEWSLATACNMRQNNPNLFYTFAMEQLKVHEDAEGGWTLWTWKVATTGNTNVEDWSLQKLLTDKRLAEMFHTTSR